MLELNLMIANAEGALLRALGLIERRGFQLASVSCDPCAQGWQVRLTLADGGRPADVLLRQIRRLADVRCASLDIARPAFALPPPARQPAALGTPPCNRRSFSFLGLPERVSVVQAGVA
ncbi:MAG: ACT domain-containing protein [Lysobacteraceae bacterium]